MLLKRYGKYYCRLHRTLERRKLIQGKAVALAQCIIDTQLAINRALAVGEPWGSVLARMVKEMGKVQFRMIRAQPIEPYIGKGFPVRVNIKTVFGSKRLAKFLWNRHTRKLGEWKSNLDCRVRKEHENRPFKVFKEILK